MTAATDVTIAGLTTREIAEVSSLLAHSFSTNPNHLAIFKSTNHSAIEKQRKMFEMVLKNPNNKSFTAKVNNQIVGSMTYTTSEHCQLHPLDLIKSMPRLVNMLGIRHLFPVLKWRMNWAKNDYKSRHNHFGPIAVRSAYQGKGIGKSLLKYYCNYLDQTNQIGYLETDKEANSYLYEQFDFEIIKMDKISGIVNWFMVRKPNNQLK